MSFTIVEQAAARLNRSELAVPGSNPALFEKAAASAADVVFLDLEDAVAPDDKEQARKNIIQALNDVDWGPKTLSVRINGLDTHYMYRDVVDIIEQGGELGAVLAAAPTPGLRRRWSHVQTEAGVAGHPSHVSQPAFEEVLLARRIDPGPFQRFDPRRRLEEHSRVGRQGLEGGLPTENYRLGVMETVNEIDAVAVRDKVRIDMESCFACSVRCKKVVQVEKRQEDAGTTRKGVYRSRY